MNPSRISYSYPADSNLVYSKDAILKPCEFCSRTFIPDSLVRHKKICYKEYLKKRSKISKQSTISSSKTSKPNAGDLSVMNITELMIKRQIRRMQWRTRHEDFIKSIRDAREYVIATKFGIKVNKPSSATEQKEEMHQCKYCLRKFHKDSLEKHLKRCQEYSIQSIRSRPNDAQIEAKRRLSLRLYYKPQSFDGDSADNLNTSISSNDFDDLQSLATNYSQSAHSHKSVSTSESAMSNVKNHSNISNTRFRTPVAQHGKQGMQKRYKSVSRRSKQMSAEPTSCSGVNRRSPTTITIKEKCTKEGPQKYNESSSSPRNKNSHTNGKSKDKSNCNTFDSINSSKTLKGYCNKSRHGHTSSKSKDQTMSFSNNISNEYFVTPDFMEYEDDFVRPNPAESLRKAKEIINFLEERSQQVEYVKSYEFPLNEDDEADKTDQELYSDIDETFSLSDKDKMQAKNVDHSDEDSFFEDIKANKNVSTGCVSCIDNDYQKSEELMTTKTLNKTEVSHMDIMNSPLEKEKIVEKVEGNADLAPKTNLPSCFHADPDYVKIWK